MQPNTSNLSRAALAVKLTNDQGHVGPSHAISDVTCTTCGYHGYPTMSGSNRACHRCGNHITAESGEISSRNPWIAYWGDALVVIALAVLAYLLAPMAWNAFFRL